MLSHFNLIVIGGGASGIFAAINAAEKGASVLVLEKSNKLLAKVKVSGGGRCNTTHSCFTVNDLLKKYPRGVESLKPVFKQFQPKDTIEWFAKRGVTLKTETDGRMFPTTDSSQTIIDCFLNEARKNRVEIKTSVTIESILKKDLFEIKTATETFTATNLLIAIGGNVRGVVHDFLTTTHHQLIEEVPSLFTFNIPHHPILKLMGMVVENAKVKITGTDFVETGPVLITHWGMSGPAILRLSAYAAREIFKWQNDFTIEINWLGTQNENDFRQWFQQFRNTNGSKKLFSKNPFELPNRLWDFILQENKFPEKLNWADLNKEQLKLLMNSLLQHQFHIKGKTTYKEEFVTSGGIDLNCVDLKTMQSTKVPHLFFAGEVLNVDGITGGFNFQFAWSGGWIVSEAV